MQDSKNMGIEIEIKRKYRDFSLDISIKTDSKRIGILGASGCGKTLTLKAIAGLIKPDSGIVIVDEQVLFDSEKKTDVKAKNRNVGYLFQNYALFPHMTVEQNIKAALHGKNAPIKNVDEILQTFQIADIRTHYPSEISGGQQQRTALARVFACDPDILLLDEPFSAMDTYMREGLRLELIRFLEKYDKTVILVSHDRDEIYQMCDYLVLVDEGKVLTQGISDEIFAHPQTPKIAKLTGCKNISRIEKIDEHRLCAVDWDDLILTTSEIIGDDITYAGIRAHDFLPGRCGENDIPTGNSKISRLPFEWYVTLENGLWWKIPKSLSEDTEEFEVPACISVKPEKILLMKSEEKD